MMRLWIATFGLNLALALAAGAQTQDSQPPSGDGSGMPEAKPGDKPVESAPAPAPAPDPAPAPAPEGSGEQKKKRKGGGAFGLPSVEQLAKDLTLTEEQTKKLQELYDNAAADLKELRKKAKDEGTDKQGLRDQTVELRKKLVEEIKALLTEEQVEKFNKILDGMKKKGKK